jgi:hypothetical protein
MTSLVRPKFFNLLSLPNCQEYSILRVHFHESCGRSRKGERLDIFNDRLATIRRFVERHDDDDWKRALVCGVFFLPDSLALNIQQLRVLVGKCKSSINGSLQQLGYRAVPPGLEAEQQFLTRIPQQCRDLTDLKKWTVRKTAAEKNATFLVPLPIVTKSPVNVETEAVAAAARRQFPCPVKCRYKYLDIIHRSVSIQTEP